MERRQQVIDEIFGLYERFGDCDYIGEPVSQIEHMSQAAQLALAEGYDDEVVLAAFFHDIGHICQQDAENMGGFGVVSHERLGADYLRRAGFSERLARLVEYHVQAKRYLTFKDPGYYQRLSEASRRTLEYQGGVMSAAEAAAFELDPLWAVSLRMRHWDEQAKEMWVPVMDLQVLKENHPLVGAVHGSGFYLGLELIRDHATPEPATEETTLLCERLRELGIFMQPTGDHLNILKIKPPMVTTRQSVDFFVDMLAKVLSEEL